MFLNQRLLDDCCDDARKIILSFLPDPRRVPHDDVEFTNISKNMYHKLYHSKHRDCVYNLRVAKSKLFK